MRGRGGARRGPRSLLQDLRAQGLPVHLEVLDLSRMGAPADLAASLGLRPFSPVVRRLRLSRGRPLAGRTSLLPERPCPGILRLDFVRRSLSGTLREGCGDALAGGRTAIRASLAEPGEGRPTRFERPAAVQHTLIAGGEVIERCPSSFSGAGFELGSDESGPAPGAPSPLFAAGKA